MRKFYMQILQICPPNPSGVVTLPWEIQKSHFQQYYSYIFLIIYVISEENKLWSTCPPPPKNVTTLTCKLQFFFIRLKVCCVLSNAGGSGESQLWVVVGGSEKNRLWCVATGMPGRQCHSKCSASEWPSSALIHASSLFDTGQSHSTSRCAEIQPMSQQAAAVSLNLRYDTRCYFNVRSKADMNRLNLPHGDDNWKL